MWSRVREWLRVVVPTWSQLNQFGESRALRTAPVWAVLIPIPAKLMSLLPDEIPLGEVGAESVSLSLVDLDIPFSWRVLFVSSLLVTLANAIYSLSCPRVVRVFRNAAEWVAAEGMTGVTIEYGIQTGDRSCVGNPFSANSQAYVCREVTGQRLVSERSPLDAGNALRNEQDSSKFDLRLQATVAYLLGLGGLAWVLLENAAYVLLS